MWKFYLRMCSAFGTVTLTLFFVSFLTRTPIYLGEGGFWTLILGSAVYGAVSGKAAAPQLPAAVAVQLPPGQPFDKAR